MSSAKTDKLFNYMDQRELALCLVVNRTCQRRAIHGFFKVISRLGDGIFWYTVMAVLPLVQGLAGLVASLHMLVVSAFCLIIYKWLKPRAMRRRPYLQDEQIHLGTAPLDYYSFPSGHTLHAVAFTIIAVSHFPGLAWLLVPFSACVALSRVILGLHYPSDVLIGAAIGALVALLSVLAI